MKFDLRCLQYCPEKCQPCSTGQWPLSRGADYCYTLCLQCPYGDTMGCWSACFTSHFESEYDPFGAGHGCNSLSAGLGMAVARDISGRKNRIVTVISNWTTMAGQVYEAMGHAGFLDSNMVVILNESRHTLLPKADGWPKMSVNTFSSAMSKIQSSKGFRNFREAAKVGFPNGLVKECMNLLPKLRSMPVSRFPDRFFDAGIAEQHAVTFSAGLACGGLKPFCIIPSTFLQRSYDQIVEDVDIQKIPVRFAITSAVIEDRSICFRYPRGAIVGTSGTLTYGNSLEIGKGEILAEGKERELFLAMVR